MDDQVRRALAKWPNVPDCYGWLALDRRGRWRMRDEHAQAHGLPGDIVRHASLAAFIDRNYDATLRGEWFFQNGPQRVFVDLEATPFVLFADDAAAFGNPQLTTHTGEVVQAVRTAYLDEAGNFLLAFECGRPGLQIGLVCDRDLPVLLHCLRDAQGQEPGAQQTLDLLAESPFSLCLVLPQAVAPLRLHSIAAADLPDRFDFRRIPGPARHAAASSGARTLP